MSEQEPATSDEITMGQLIDLYHTSDNADVVRAAMILLHGDPLIASFRDPAEFERTKANAMCTAALNKREKPTPTHPGRLNEHGAYICGPCSDGNHLGVQHGGSQHALCQCTCDGMHYKYGQLRPARVARPIRSRNRR